MITRALEKELEAVSNSNRRRNPLPSIRLPKDAPVFNLGPEELKNIDAAESP